MANVQAATRVEERSVESSASAVEWAAIFGGGLAALGVTAILLTLGPGLGLTTVSPWSFNNPSPTTFGTAASIWLVVTQWLSSAFGGYLSGRLRTKWVGIPTDEVLFRDTAHVSVETDEDRKTLDELIEKKLILGNQLTEAGWRELRKFRGSLEGLIPFAAPSGRSKADS